MAQYTVIQSYVPFDMCVYVRGYLMDLVGSSRSVKKLLAKLNMWQINNVVV